LAPARLIEVRHPLLFHVGAGLLDGLGDYRGRELLRLVEAPHAHRHTEGFCRKVRFWGKIQKSGIRNSMAYRLPSSRKSNFATEPSLLLSTCVCYGTLPSSAALYSTRRGCVYRAPSGTAKTDFLATRLTPPRFYHPSNNARILLVNPQ